MMGDDSKKPNDKKLKGTSGSDATKVPPDVGGALEEDGDP
jgi:hypothetical protein